MLVDSHAHLNFRDYASDFEEVIARAKEAGVEKIINIGTSMADAQEVIGLAEKFDCCFAAVGLHPNDDPKITVESIDWKMFEKTATSKKVVAIGECGLDYSRLQSTDYSLQQNEKRRQKNLFKKQIEIAQKLNLPLSIHVRDAQEDAMEILDRPAGGQTDKKLRGVFHCFSGDHKYLDFILTKLPGFYISFAGNITFPAKAGPRTAVRGKNAQPLCDLAKDVPLDRMLVETDCPFLTPEPNRGKRNEPANVKFTAEVLGQVKGLNLAEIGKITSENAEKLFNI